MLMYMAWRLGNALDLALRCLFFFIFLVGLGNRPLEEPCIRGWSRCNISCYLRGVLYLLELSVVP
jgi:hypothetical protein